MPLFIALIFLFFVLSMTNTLYLCCFVVFYVCVVYLPEGICSLYRGSSFLTGSRVIPLGRRLRDWLTLGKLSPIITNGNLPLVFETRLNMAFQ